MSTIYQTLQPIKKSFIFYFRVVVEDDFVAGVLVDVGSDVAQFLPGFSVSHFNYDAENKLECLCLESFFVSRHKTLGTKQ